MLNRLILANLRARPVRSFVSMLAVAIEVALILLIVGLTNGMVKDQRDRVRGVGADIVVRPPNASLFTGLTGNPLPIKLGDVLARQPGVKAVAAVSIQTNNNSLLSISGIDLAQFTAVSGGFRFFKGGPFRESYEVIVDDLQASSGHIEVGQAITLLNHSFRVTGIFEHGKGSRVYVPIETLDNLAGTPGRASLFYVKLVNPAETDAAVERLNKLLPGYTILPMEQYLSLFTSANMPGLPIFQATMIGIATIIGFLVIFLSMYTTILERTREIGILKALGASKRYIVNAILRETTALSVGGIVAGILIAAGVRAALTAAFPTLTLNLTVSWAWRAAVIAIVGGVIGALYPAARAAAQDPIAALAYE